MSLDIHADELNNILFENNKVIFDLLSEKGRAIFFPKKGILSQAADANDKEINATIGMALEDDLNPMCLNCFTKKINISPKNSFLYAPSFGKKELRKKWKDLIIKKNPSLKGKISLPIVTNAITHGLSMCGYLFVNQHDKIILPDLFWGNYKLVFQKTYGAEFDLFQTFVKDSFNILGLTKKLNESGEKKIVLLNFPNNPSGYTPTKKEVENIVKVLKDAASNGKKILVIIDDAYFGLVYKEGIYEESLFTELSNLHKNILVVKLDGVTKEDYAWGLRVGFVTFGIKGANEDIYSVLEVKLSGAIRGNISNASNLSQQIVLEGLLDKNYDSEKKEKFDLLKKRFEEIVGVLENKKYEKYFRALPFNSGYFMCIKLNELSGEDVRQQLLKNSVGVIAMGNVLRIAFSSVPTGKIPVLFEKIYAACEQLSG